VASAYVIAVMGREGRERDERELLYTRGNVEGDVREME
jgi:hypothetical protein